MLYNLPDATGVNLGPDTVGRLAREVDNIRYIKDTSADMAQAGQLIHRYGDVISTFLGWDSLMLAALTAMFVKCVAKVDGSAIRDVLVESPVVNCATAYSVR
jgi:dihydrodipicolinate synthase/N-acetylneuraminate lyase